jgi:hypothetical protein
LYEVTVQNSTDAPITASDGSTIAPGGSWKSGAIGDAYLHSDQFGSMSFVDIGDQHIPGDTNETWGCLITYQGEHMVGRYEGGGQLSVTFNKYLQATLAGMDIRQVQLNALVIEGQTTSA